MYIFIYILLVLALRIQWGHPERDTQTDGRKSFCLMNIGLVMQFAIIRPKWYSSPKALFSERSGTLDIKGYNSWNNSDTLAVVCLELEESIIHLMSYEAYGRV